MKITVINGTEKHGITYKLKEVFLDQLRNEAEITEFYSLAKTRRSPYFLYFLYFCGTNLILWSMAQLNYEL